MKKFMRIFLFLFLFLSALRYPLSAANAAIPAAGAVLPSTGSSAPETAKTFTSIYSDLDGWQNLKEAYFLVSSGPAVLANAVWLYYDQNTNKLYLRDDANTVWLGGFAPGSANVIQNSQVKINCGLSTAAGLKSRLTVKWNITFKTLYSGKTYNTYLSVKDDSGNSVALTKKGTYALNFPPRVKSIAPSSGSSAPGVAMIFTALYTDSDGWKNTKAAYLLINALLSYAKCLYGYYNQDTNKLYLRNDVNTTWLGGFAPGSANVIQNSYAQLDCAKTVVSGEAQTLTIQWAVSFKPIFKGLKNTYLYIKDDFNLYQGWIKKGAWTIQADTTPPTGSVLINNNKAYTNTTAVTLNLSAQDNTGGSGLNQMKFSKDNLNWSAPETFASTKTWVLSAGEGLKTVYVRFSDKAGNWSAFYSDIIILDIQAPAFSINPVTSPTNQDVTLSYSVSDNFTSAPQIKITGDQSPYTAEGAQNPNLSACDLAGNCAQAKVSFVIDKTPPVLTITSPHDQATLDTPQSTVSGTAQDNVGVASVSVNGQPVTTTDNYAAWSAEVSLTPDVNTIAILARDQAGNITSSSLTVTYNAGTLIGIEGGDVLSSDGKVKLVIPAGALNEPTYIKISPINKDNLSSLTPQNTSLLSVVECKPYGLVFNQPVEIIYTLDNAEVPGTPIELGLYDRIQNIITSTGQNSVIPVDGYSVSFSILHFSTYTALKNLTPQSTPIGSGVKIPLPDLLTGAFSHAIPITVIPGRKGMQPALGLSYRSGGANSWVGLGFSLNPGYITRSTRLGPATYNDIVDTFYLITDAGTTELVHLIDNLYQAKVESSFTKFFKEANDSWRVLAKDGSQLFFGQTAYAREAGSGGTFSWSLTEARDTNGNYLTYVYTQDQGKSYLSRIDYTAHESGISAANSVDFLLESRGDIASNYLSGNRIATAKRLKTIEVKQGADLVWRYNLEYTPSPDTSRSLLTRVTQSANDGTAFPAQSLGYQKAK